MDKIMLMHWRLPVLNVKTIENNDFSKFQSIQLRVDQNTELLASFYRCEPRHRLSENWKTQISSEDFLSLPFFIEFLPSPHLDSHLCDARSVWHPWEKRFWKRDMRVKPLLEIVRSFNSSSRGVSQGLNKLGHSILLTSSSFCFPSSPSTPFVTIKH